MSTFFEKLCQKKIIKAPTTVKGRNSYFGARNELEDVK